MKRIPWNLLRKKVLRLPSLAAEHAFLFTLFLIGVALAFSLFLFYLYGFSSQTKYGEQGTSLYDVKEELFSGVLAELEKREQSLQNARKQLSRDIFNPD